MRKNFAPLFLLLLPCSHLSAQENGVPLFTRVPPDSSKVTFRNTLTESVDLNIITYEYFFNGGGVAAGDINNDGLIDLYFTGNMVENKLYLNKGNMKFEDITKTAGVGGHAGWKTGVTMADVNGDGLLDIYVCYSGKDSAKRGNQLFINQGNKTFRDEAKQYGLDAHDYSTQAAFFDCDHDGDLDMYLLNHNVLTIRRFDASAMKSMRDPHAGDKLFRNDNGHFVDVSAASGIKGNPIGFGLGIAIADFNKDGWPDIYVSNDYTEQDYCYINNADGTFTDRLESMMGHISNFSMGDDAADFNNDGLVDMMTLDMLPPDNYRQKLFFVPDNYEMYQGMIDNHFYHQLMRNMLQLNNGDGTFSEIGQLAGVSNTDWSWSTLFADFNNDGNKDLLMTNGYLRDMINMDFQKFYADERLKVSKGERNEKILQMLKQIPSTPLHNYVFKNNGDLTFTDESSAWGFTEKNFSNGAVCADLDNDGDLDIVINRLNNTPAIYENNLPPSHFLDVQFSDQGSKNDFGIGTSVTLYSEGKKQYQEFNPSRGFQSGMHIPLHFGLMKEMVDSLEVDWTDGHVQKLFDVKVDQKITVHHDAAGQSAKYSAQQTGKEIFDRAQPIIKYVNEEDNFNDFKQQPLMPNMISFCGPRCARGDVNGDHLDDFYFCGAKNHPGKLFLQSSNGTFTESKQPPFDRDMAKQDADALFFDADDDGDQDLYVVSGGYQYKTDDTLLQDRIYFNENGNFIRHRQSLPKETTSGSCVKAADIDGDGDLDLFVGGRVIPGRYPESPKSFILINNGKGIFSDATDSLCPSLTNVGMVTDALWLDINKDHQPDLILVGEWMPVKIFINHGGHFEDESSKYLKENSSGWWNRIYAADMDHDGDSDLVIGNLGLNSQVKVSENEKAALLYGDFDNNGSVDPFIFCYIDDTLSPLASRDETLDQMISLRKKFTNYDQYAKASLNDILTPEQQQQAKKLEADRFETSYLENDGDHFEFKSLPAEAQFAPVFGITSLDYDGDGNGDLILGGDMQHVRIRFGKYDANYGVLLKGDGKGNFVYVPQSQSGLSVHGDVRDIFQVKNSSGSYVVFAMNQQSVQVYKLNKK